MRIACMNINNNGITLSKSLINKTIFKYNGILGRALFKLYDLGYQSSPSIFDKENFRSILNLDFPDDVDYLRNNLRGNLDIDDELLVKYAILKSSNDLFKEVLSIYLDILTATHALEAYDIFFSKVKVPKKVDLIKVKSRLSVSGGVGNFNVIPLDSPAIWESFVISSDEYLEVYDTTEVLIKQVILHLGYSEDDYLAHKNSGQPFFISGISQQDELSIFPAIVNGKINADGKFGSLLTKDISDYYANFYLTHDNTKISCSNYEEVIFNDCIDERIKLNNIKRESLAGKSYREFYVTSTKIIFAIKEENAVFKSNSYIKDGKIRMGVATLSHENRAEFSKINVLCGLSGEFVSETTVKLNNWLTVGQPIMIKFGTFIGNKFRLNELSYYPFYNVYYNLDGEFGCNVKPLLGNDIQIVVSDIKDIFYSLRVSSKQSLYSKVLRFVDASEFYIPRDCNVVKFSRLIADLTMALLYAECGETEYEMCSMLDFDNISDEVYYQACVRAEEVFKSMGF